MINNFFNNKICILYLLILLEKFNNKSLYFSLISFKFLVIKLFSNKILLYFSSKVFALSIISIIETSKWLNVSDDNLSLTIFLRSSIFLISSTYILFLLAISLNLKIKSSFIFLFSTCLVLYLFILCVKLCNSILLLLIILVNSEILLFR